MSATGAGIAKEKLARSFDPFFNATPVGKGTSFRIVLPVRHAGP